MDIRKISLKIAGIESLNWNNIPRNEEFWKSEETIEILDKIHRVLTAPKDIEISKNLRILMNKIDENIRDIEEKAETAHMESGIYEKGSKRLRNILHG